MRIVRSPKIWGRYGVPQLWVKGSSGAKRKAHVLATVGYPQDLWIKLWKMGIAGVLRAVNMS
jgi:hypothetical protein